MERYAKNELFVECWHNFVRDYTRLDANKEVVKVLVCCPRGTKRSVAGAEILKYCVQSMGTVVEKENRHLSEENWNSHPKLCSQCRQHTNQKRYREVLEKAVQLVNT